MGNADIWPKMPVLGQIWPLLGQKSIFMGEGVKFLVPSYQETKETLLLCWKHWPGRLHLATSDENVKFDLKIWMFWAKSHFFCLRNKIFDNMAHHHSPIYLRLQQKNIRFQARGHFLGLTPALGNLGERTWSQPELQRNSHFYVWPKSFFLAKKKFSQKDTQKPLKFINVYLGIFIFESQNAQY